MNETSVEDEMIYQSPDYANNYGESKPELLDEEIIEEIVDEGPTWADEQHDDPDIRGMVFTNSYQLYRRTVEPRARSSDRVGTPNLANGKSKKRMSQLMRDNTQSQSHVTVAQQEAENDGDLHAFSPQDAWGHKTAPSDAARPHSKQQSFVSGFSFANQNSSSRTKSSGGLGFGSFPDQPDNKPGLFRKTSFFAEAQGIGGRASVVAAANQKMDAQKIPQEVSIPPEVANLERPGSRDGARPQNAVPGARQLPPGAVLVEPPSPTKKKRAAGGRHGRRL